MTATLVGQVSIGQCVPTTASLVGASLTQLQAQLVGAIAAQAHIAITPPTLATSLTAALALVESLKASIALGLPGVNAAGFSKLVRNLPRITSPRTSC